MIFDLNEILCSFAVLNGRLVRRLAGGKSSYVTLVKRGRLRVQHKGIKYDGPEIAYACLYEVVPMFRIVQIDGNPLNMDRDNLMPARLRFRHFKARALGSQFYHNLSTTLHDSEDACRREWQTLVRSYYLRDFGTVRKLEDATKVGRPPVGLGRPAHPGPSRTAKKPVKSAREAVEGRSWHCWKGSWVSLPDAVHESDDWMVRAQVLLEHPGAVFRYCPELERTVYSVE